MRYDEKGNLKPMSDRQVVATARRWTIIAFIALVVLSVGGWWLGVALSGPKGRGQQIKDINKANNRTFAQEQFHELLADIRAYDAQIGIQQAALNNHPTQDGERSRLAQVVAGIQTQCVSTVEQYNAEARKISREKFRDSDLPEQVDTQDPNYDCKENAR